MKKVEIIKKNMDFSKILEKKHRISNKYFSIYYDKGNKFNKYGISIPKKTGNAVVRNKLKRQIKNIISINKNSIQIAYDYVIIVRNSILNLTYPQMEEELLKLLKRNGEKNEEKH